VPIFCHIAIRVEAYRAQNGLSQCHNCQQFCHVSANSEQLPRCLWCGVCHLHKECPEKRNASSTPTCCNCRLAEEENPNVANYQDCRRAKEEMQKKKCKWHPGLPREGCSLPTSPLQAYPSRRGSQARQRSGSSLRHIRWQWQVQPQWNLGSLRPYPNTNSRQ
jgi:hypothetical protein